MSDRLRQICESVSDYRADTGHYPTAQQVCEWCRTTLESAVRAIAIVRHKIEG